MVTIVKTSDYIVDFLINKNVTDVFGYPGGMVTHLMDSLGQKQDRIKTHITYHEQAAAFAACGYAQASDRIGVAFATSGPGATNLITGIGNAYFDSIPTLFITGQVNTFESKRGSSLRQKGFQETDITTMVTEITKKAYYVEEADRIPEILEEAYAIAMSGRKGPVLIDVPMNVFRTDISVDGCNGIELSDTSDENEIKRFENTLVDALKVSKRPCLLIGNGIKIDHQISNIRGILRSCPLPVVSSMLSVDVVPEGQGLEGIYYGFVGAYGNRTANFVVAKSDLVICLGSRLDVRQVGGKREQFAPNARIIRVDIDTSELNNKIREDEESFALGLSDVIPVIRNAFLAGNYSYSEWLKVCQEIKKQIKYTDEKEPNRYVNSISKRVPDGYGIVADVGQHMIWVAQSFKMKPEQRIYFSGGMGSMGYALPAAIGVYYATHRPVICFVGDGGLQMNIQEFQFLVREKIPVKIVILNNSALGMIRHFQEMYFESNYYFTVKDEGYSTPDFVKIAEAYGIPSHVLREIDEMKGIDFEADGPELFEIIIKGNTYVYPKLEFGKPNQDQEPLLDRSLYNYLMEL